MNGTQHGEGSSSAAAIDYYPFDMGAHHHPITTSNPLAQAWFDRGLNWAFGFQHEEAVKCYKLAIEADRDCAMAYWGVAYSAGPHYNFGWESIAPALLPGVVRMTYEYAAKAVDIAKASHFTPLEKAVIGAMQARYPSPEPTSDFSVWHRNFCDAMERVFHNFSDDLDVTSWYVDAMMMLTPWNFWEIGTLKPQKDSRALEIKSVLETVLTRPEARKHAGLLHEYIHLIEMSAKPELALRAADDLRALLSDRGHLNHMPSHIDVLIGEYRNAVASNQAAIDADAKYMARCTGKPGPIFSIYSLHNHHSLIYAAMLAAQYQTAMDACTKLEAMLPEELLRVEEPSSMVDFAEFFTCARSHVLIRFGKWEEILALDFPEDAAFYCSLTATLHYAKGIAHAALGQIPQAEEQLQHFLAAKALVPESRLNFPCKMHEALEVGVSMLSGELAYRKGDMDTAFTHLRKAVEIDDALPYGEPAAWMVPTRHALAALLLEQGEAEEAAKVYVADLGLDKGSIPRPRQHLSNVWALHGFHECLIRLHRTAEADLIKPQLDLAIAAADVPIESSCFCRRNGTKAGCC